MAAPWANRAQRRQRPSSYQYLLDLDVELADELDVRMRLVARPAVTAVTFEADAGELDPGDRLTASGTGLGLLVLDGVLAVNVRVGDRISAELVGGGDVLQRQTPEVDDLLACEIGWRALEPVRFAVLDSAFAERVRPWPQITQVLLQRAGRRTRSLGIQRAIAAQPRLEVRLTLLLWHLAGRWGKVEQGGIRLPLPLTHQLLGRLIGAERPSVSHALARLTHARVLSAEGDGWHLHGSLHDHLAAMLEAGQRREQVAAAVSALRPS